MHPDPRRSSRSRPPLARARRLARAARGLAHGTQPDRIRLGHAHGRAARARWLEPQRRCNGAHALPEHSGFAAAAAPRSTSSAEAALHRAHAAEGAQRRTSLPRSAPTAGTADGHAQPATAAASSLETSLQTCTAHYDRILQMLVKEPSNEHLIELRDQLTNAINKLQDTKEWVAPLITRAATEPSRPSGASSDPTRLVGAHTRLAARARRSTRPRSVGRAASARLARS